MTLRNGGTLRLSVLMKPWIVSEMLRERNPRESSHRGGGGFWVLDVSIVRDLIIYAKFWW